MGEWVTTSGRVGYEMTKKVYKYIINKIRTKGSFGSRTRHQNCQSLHIIIDEINEKSIKEELKPQRNYLLAREEIGSLGFIHLKN